jgi:hypothetical protein
MDDKEILQWLVDRDSELDKFIDQSAAKAKPGRLEVFHKLLATKNAIVMLLWEINIAREREGLPYLMGPHH